jgi:NADH-quinone oxidoreductase subunit J
VTAVLFFAFSAIVLGSAFGVILARNPVHSALFLVLTLIAIAGFFLLLDADLVAIVQIVVYASAIVVLFLFVITLLGVDKPEPFDDSHPVQRVAAVVIGVLALVGILVLAHGNRWVTGAHSTRGALGSVESGNVETLAKSLFTDFVWAFEMTAVLLVIAVVGSVVLARRSGHRPVAPVDGADMSAEPERTPV